ncbi:hypothetical protein [Staphylococcus aureus]
MAFFKQKTAYEIAQCLVGSEMCIRDSPLLLEILNKDCSPRIKGFITVSYTHLTLPTTPYV